MVDRIQIVNFSTRANVEPATLARNMWKRARNDRDFLLGLAIRNPASATII